MIAPDDVLACMSNRQSSSEQGLRSGEAPRARGTRARGDDGHGGPGPGRDLGLASHDEDHDAARPGRVRIRVTAHVDSPHQTSGAQRGLERRSLSAGVGSAARGVVSVMVYGPHVRYGTALSPGLTPGQARAAKPASPYRLLLQLWMPGTNDEDHAVRNVPRRIPCRRFGKDSRRHSPSTARLWVILRSGRTRKGSG